MPWGTFSQELSAPSATLPVPPAASTVRTASPALWDSTLTRLPASPATITALTALMAPFAFLVMWGSTLQEAIPAWLATSSIRVAASANSGLVQAVARAHIWYHRLSAKPVVLLYLDANPAIIARTVLSVPLATITQGAWRLTHVACAPQSVNLAHQPQYVPAAKLAIGSVQPIAPFVLLLALLVTPQELTASLA